MRKFYLFLLIFTALVPLLDFFQPGLPVTHDGQDHVARIANFYQSLSEGNVIPRWAANLNWGYGHPILMFLYPLPSYLASFFHFLGFGLVKSVKIVFGLSLVLSGLFMYFWIREAWGEEAGFVAGLFYMFAPYRFVDLYVRGAIGECLAFVWPPLICYFAFKLSRQLKWFYVAGGSFSLAALILSHNALSLMFLPVILGYMIWLGFFGDSKRVACYMLLVTLFLGFSLSAFFWFPALLEGKYTLRDIVTQNNITGFENFSRLIWSPWSYGGTGSLSVQIGILQWLGIAFSPFLIWKLWQKKDKNWLFGLFLLVCFWGAVFLILPSSRWLYFKIPLLQKFQFVWRFLSLAVFPPAVFLGAFVYLLPKRFKLLVTCYLLLVTLLLNRDYWHAKDFLYQSESFYQEAYASSTDTGESAPRWSVRFMERFPEASIEVISGEAEIEEISRLSNRHEFKVKAQAESRLVDNTLYFPGWDVLVDDRPVEVEFQDPNYRGLMTFNVPMGERQVIVRFRETKLRKFADLVSLVSLGLLLASGIIKITLKTPPRWPNGLLGGGGKRKTILL